eukprot:scaffold120241_cov32-Tisochrysis_lutea.AAC.1
MSYEYEPEQPGMTPHLHDKVLQITTTRIPRYSTPRSSNCQSQKRLPLDVVPLPAPPSPSTSASALGSSSARVSARGGMGRALLCITSLAADVARDHHFRRHLGSRGGHRGFSRDERRVGAFVCADGAAQARAAAAASGAEWRGPAYRAARAGERGVALRHGREGAREADAGAAIRRPHIGDQIAGGGPQREVRLHSAQGTSRALAISASEGRMRAAERCSMRPRRGQIERGGRGLEACMQVEADTIQVSRYRPETDATRSTMPCCAWQSVVWCRRHVVCCMQCVL